jgi:hypothetical protein
MVFNATFNIFIYIMSVIVAVGFTTIYAIGAYHHWCYGFDSHSGKGVQHHEITFVSDLRQVGGFLSVHQ